MRIPPKLLTDSGNVIRGGAVAGWMGVRPVQTWVIPKAGTYCASEMFAKMLVEPIAVIFLQAQVRGGGLAAVGRCAQRGEVFGLFASHF